MTKKKEKWMESEEWLSYWNQVSVDIDREVADELEIYISNLIQLEKDKMIEILDEMAFEQDNGSEVNLFIDWDKAKESLTDNNQ